MTKAVWRHFFGAFSLAFLTPMLALDANADGVMLPDLGVGCSQLNSVSLDSFTALTGAECPVSDPAPWINPKCATTIKQVVGFSTVFKAASDATISSVSTLGNALQAAAPGVGMAASYRSCLDLTKTSRTDISSSLKNIDGPLANIQSSLAAHQTNLQNATGHLRFITTNASSACKTAMSLEANPSSAAEGRAASQSVSTQCSLWGPKPVSGIECEPVCMQAAQDLQKVITEQQRMIKLLTAAQADALKKQSGMVACLGSDQSVADTCTTGLSNLLSPATTTGQGGVDAGSVNTDEVTGTAKTAAAAAQDGTGKLLATTATADGSTTAEQVLGKLATKLEAGPATPYLVAGQILFDSTSTVGWPDDQSLGLQMLTNAANSNPNDTVLQNLAQQTNGMVPGNLNGTYYNNVMQQMISEQAAIQATKSANTWSAINQGGTFGGS